MSVAGDDPVESRPPVGPSEARAFRERGFLLVHNLLSTAELKHFSSAVDSAVAERTRHDERSLEERTRYEQSFQQCLNLWEDFPEVRPLTFHPRIARAAAQLLDVPAVRIWHDQALYKRSGGRVTDPHQDQPYWSIAEPRTITAWIPFQDVAQENGAVGYLPGSHVSGLETFADIFSGTGLDLDAHVETRGRAFEFLDVPAGSVAFHHGLTVHRAHPNHGPSDRRVHTIIFFADGCTRTEMPHPSVDRPGIAVGAPIDSDVTPIAWPRPESSLPTPPPLPDPPIPGWAGFRPNPENLRRFAEKIKRERVVERLRSRP